MLSMTVLAVAGDVPAWVAVLMTALGGVVVKLGDRWLFNKHKNQQLDVTAAEQLRAELHTEIREVKEEQQELRDDLDKWRDRYFKLRHAYNNIKTRCKLLHLELLVVRGDVKPEDLHKLYLSDTAHGNTPVLDALNINYDDSFLDEVDEEIRRDDEERRKKLRVKRPATKPRKVVVPADAGKDDAGD